MRDFHARTNYRKGGLLNEDELVIVEDEELPRHRWKLGTYPRVVELVKAKDGILRGARVKIGSTGAIIGRPLNKLCKLELTTNRTQQDTQTSSNMDMINSQHTSPRVLRPRREAVLCNKYKNINFWLSARIIDLIIDLKGQLRGVC